MTIDTKQPTFQLLGKLLMPHDKLIIFPNENE